MAKNDIENALSLGALIRIRRGWYGLRDSDARVRAAVASGAVVSCVSALDLHGVWAAPGGLIHVRETEHRERIPLPKLPAVHLCRSVERNARPCPSAVDDMASALVSMVHCRPLWESVAALDSILYQGMADAADLRSLLFREGERARAALEVMDGIRESGLESCLHVRLRAAGIQHECQVWNLGYRNDIQVGRRLLMEADGRTFHDTALKFDEDRERDRRLAAAGFHVVRLSYKQVMFEMDQVMDDILHMVRRGDHMRRYRS